MIDKDYYTTKEVAEYLMVDVQTVRKYIREGKIKAEHLGARVIRIPRSSIEYLFRSAK